VPALRKLTVENFKSLRDVEVPLGALNVLVGPNEAGKSNFLDVIQFLGDSVRSDLGPAIEERGGYDRVRFRGEGRAGAVVIKVEADVTRYASPTAPDEYTLRFFVRRQRTGQVLVRTEDFRFKRYKGRGRRITISGAQVEVIDEDFEGVAEREETTGRLQLRHDALALSTLPRLAPEEGGGEVTRGRVDP
jgi:predicted ATPase